MPTTYQHCHTTIIEGQHSVVLTQSGRKGRTVFAVQYGSHSRTGLTYQQAAAEYGQCIMHALACAGQLDNTGAD